MNMKRTPVLHTLAARMSGLSGEAKLSLAAGASCCAVGITGSLVNYIRPDTTTLSALAAVGCAYLAAGILSALGGQHPSSSNWSSTNDGPPGQLAAPRPRPGAEPHAESLAVLAHSRAPTQAFTDSAGPDF